MSIRAPSAKRIAEFLDESRDTAVLIRAVIRGEFDPMAIEPVARWVRQCYHRPHTGELKMEAINALMHGSGVEACLDPDARSEISPPLFTYINTGDAYSPTVIRLPGGKYILSTWGDQVERLNR